MEKGIKRIRHIQKDREISDRKTKIERIMSDKKSFPYVFSLNV